MNRECNRFNRSQNLHQFTAGVASLICLAAAFPDSANADDTLKEFISITVPADFYWPLENSYISDIQIGTTRHKVNGHEIDGIYLNDCATGGAPSGVYEATEYFPILPDHMTRVGASTALIFGETSGDLDEVDRYLEFDFDPQMHVAFGMNHKFEWTMHMIVSPADDATDRGWETLFEAGDPDYESGEVSQPIRITLGLKRESGQTRFRLQTEAGGLAVRTTEVTFDDTKVEPVNGRLWYQVIGQSYDPATGPNRIRIIVNAATDSTANPPTMWSEAASYNSNEYKPDADGVARIGIDLEDANPFHGAIQHFAIWKGLIDTDDDVSDNLDALADAFVYSATLSESDTQTPLTIDWNADPRFFIWDVPLSDASLGGLRDLRNWNDPFWDIDGVYPIVNHFTSKPNASGTNSTPPGIYDSTPTLHSWSAQSGQTPEDIAGEVANWLEYVEIGLATYAGKSLTDTNACALNWQRWGSCAPASAECYYVDDGASRGLTQNWRDTPSAWRNTGSHPYLNSSGYWDDELNEIETPLYREGMSINAFRSKDLFIELKDQIQSRSLPLPVRFHFDLESVSNINHAWAVDSGPTYYEGWWDDSVADSRADDVEFWAPPTVSSGSYATLDDIDSAYPYATNYDRFAPENESITRDLSRFFRDQFDHAFGIGLVSPAIQELNPDIRASNYGMFHTGSTGAETYLYTSDAKNVTNTDPVWFDFSAPVFYCPNYKSLTPHSASTDETLFQEWGTKLGINNLLITDDMDDNGNDPYDNGFMEATVDDVIHDDRILYVERAKHNINAIYLAGGGWDGAPISPWLEYPGTDRCVISSRFNVGSVQIPIEQDDVARIAVFACRHGASEFLFWGDYSDIIDQEDTLESLEYVFNAVEAVKAQPSDMTTTDADPGDPGYGVPDGVVDIDDITYFYIIYSTVSDLEGDFSGTDGYPDGVIDGTDWDDYYEQYLVDTM
jgi:hypothetical protein